MKKVLETGMWCGLSSVAALMLLPGIAGTAAAFAAPMFVFVYMVTKREKPKGE